MPTMYSRESFNRQRDKAATVSSAAGRLTAGVAVTFGLGQLAIIRVLNGRIAKDKELAFELALFLAYAFMVGFLVWRMDRAVTAQRIRCPKCGKALKGSAEDTAGATGKCTYCRGQVIT